MKCYCTGNKGIVALQDMRSEPAVSIAKHKQRIGSRISGEGLGSSASPSRETRPCKLDLESGCRKHCRRPDAEKTRLFLCTVQVAVQSLNRGDA